MSTEGLFWAVIAKLLLLISAIYIIQMLYFHKFSNESKEKHEQSLPFAEALTYHNHQRDRARNWLAVLVPAAIAFVWVSFVGIGPELLKTLYFFTGLFILLKLVDTVSCLWKTRKLLRGLAPME